MKKTIKVTMMRKVSSAKEWIEKAADDTRDWGIAMDVKVEKTITLTKDEFQAIADDLLEDNKIFVENSDLMRVDEQRVWHCIKLVCKELPYELYINSEGYDYARYTGIRVRGF